MTDEILAQRMPEGTAFAALVTRHCDTVYRIARNLCASAGDAEEVTRQTFLSAWRDAGSRPSGSSFRAWLCGIAMKKALALRRRRSSDGSHGWSRFSCAGIALASHRRVCVPRLRFLTSWCTRGVVAFRRLGTAVCPGSEDVQ